MSKFILPLAPGYVQHWGLWEAIREIAQNAFDQRTLDPTCGVEIHWNNGVVYIETTKGKLTPASLLLGNTTKDKNDALRGKFGEGYKLALLVLARLGLEVFVGNNDELWEPVIERNDQFESDVLAIYTSKAESATDGVRFVIGGISDEQWTAMSRNICEISDTDLILDDPREAGRLYVGGLYVNTIKGFKRGYNLRPGAIKLDRDRGTVDNFDLSYLTSKLWAARADSIEAYDLIMEKAPDVAHVDSHASRAFHEKIHARYSFLYPAHVPVTNELEIQRATNAGLAWKLVPPAIRKAVSSVVRIFIPSREPPAIRLKRVYEEVRFSISEAARQELEDIIKTLDPEQKTQHLSFPVNEVSSSS